MQDFILNALPDPVAEPALKKLQKCETATIGHFMHGCFMSRRIQPLERSRRVAGTAVTIKIAGPDSSMLHHAVSQLRRGDVLVIDRCGDDRHACLGGGVALAAVMREVAGVVVDGPMTDQSEVQEAGLAVWSTGASPITTKLLGFPSEFNTVVNVGGMCVRPGDAILADESGVVVLAPEAIESVTETALAMQAAEKKINQQVRAGARLGDLSGATHMILEKMKA